MKVVAIKNIILCKMSYQRTYVWKKYPVVLLAQYVSVRVLLLYEMLKLKSSGNVFEESIPEQT